MYDDYYGYGGLSGGALVALILLYTVLPLAVYAIYSWFYMKIFEKAGVQGKWRAWVPVYNSMIFYKLGDLSPWLLLYVLGGSLVGAIIPFLGWFLILPIVAIAARILDLIAAWRVGLKLQKDAVWVILYFFLPVVWLGINAFDKSRWNPNIAPASWAANKLLADTTVWQGIPVQPRPAAPQGYGGPQGYGAPQGYAPPAPQGYAPPAQPGYAPPAGPSAPQGPGVPPAAPSAPPAAPSAPPAAPQVPPAPPTTPPTAPPAPPSAPPAAPPAPPTDPTQPPA